jgi:oxygen-dependent protoporphyrinogen oxidase
MITAAASISQDAFTVPLHGFGFLAARNQGLHLLGALFSSALFAGRAPKGQELLTCFLGGTLEPEAFDWPDDRVWDTVCRELPVALRVAESPRPITLLRHRCAIPQYKIGHEKWVGQVKEELKQTPGLFITGNYLEGISVPACIEQGGRTGRAVADYLGRKG